VPVPLPGYGIGPAALEGDGLGMRLLTAK
jgi:hypothetical protein